MFRFLFCVIVLAFIQASQALYAATVAPPENTEAQSSPKTPVGEPSPAKDNDTDSFVSSDLKVDSGNATDFNVDGEYGFKKGKFFSLGYERAQSPSSASSPDSLDTSELRLGYGRDVNPDFGFVLNYALWGAAGQLWSNTFGLNMRWDTEDWTFHVNPQLRVITFPVNVQSKAKRLDASLNRLNIVDPLLSLSANYLGIDHWHFKLSGAYYIYSRNLSELNAPGLTKYFSSSALTLSNNFNEYDVAAEIGYSFKMVKLAIEDMYSVSQFDFTGASVYTLKSTWKVTKNVDLELDMGQSPSVEGNAAPSVQFVMFGVTYNW